ncbi:MAG: PH domain-containing protein [Nanobdellota archaeon]
MGFIDGLMGNASELEPKELHEEFSKILIKGEKIEKAYKLIRDLLIFTNKRFILVDKQGVTGKKMSIQCIPYNKITRYSIETAGTFDFDAELRIWLTSMTEPITKKFNKKLSIYEVQKTLSGYILQ